MVEIVMPIKQIFLAGFPLFFVLSLFLVLSGIVVFPVSAADVSVTAFVDEWLSFAVGTTTLDLGTLVSASGVPAIGSATTSLTLGSNSGDGFSISIQGANSGLKNSSSTYTIATPAVGATTTCSAVDPGTDAYGAQATSTGMTPQTPFNVEGDVVGSVASSSAQKILSSGYTTSTLTATLAVKASANKYDASGSYGDTLTLTAAANP